MRRLGLGDAVLLGLGSMLGAGVFATFGPAAAAGSFANLAALTLAGPGRRGAADVLAGVGLVGCLVLAVTLPLGSVLAGVGVPLAGLTGRVLARRRRR